MVEPRDTRHRTRPGATIYSYIQSGSHLPAWTNRNMIWWTLPGIDRTLAGEDAFLLPFVLSPAIRPPSGAAVSRPNSPAPTQTTLYPPAQAMGGHFSPRRIPICKLAGRTLRLPCHGRLVMLF